MTAAPRRARCSAPGKLMLFGEYAVLEGHPAIAMCLDRRIACEACTVPGGDTLELLADGVFAAPVRVPMATLLESRPPVPELSLLWPVLRAHSAVGGGLSLRFDAEFPPIWGMGSSSASTLAAAAALRYLSGEDCPASAIFTEVHAAQKQLQGAASGYDVATQLLGGYVVFEASAEVPMQRVEPPASPPLHWVVGWSRRKASPAEMLRDVRRGVAPGHPLYAEIGSRARRGISMLESGDSLGLGAAMGEGQRLLETLGAVPAELAELVERLRNCAGVLGVRLSGAGGGDCVLILAEQPEQAASAATELGLDVLDVRVEPRGLQREEIP